MATKQTARIERIVFRPKWWVHEALKDFQSKVIVAVGGLGAGKTDGGCTLLHDRITRNPKARFWWMFEPTHRKIEDAAIPKYKKAIERFGYVENRHYKITKSPHYALKYFSGQEVHFHSYDRPDLIVATEIGGAVLDEAFDAELEAYRNIRARIRDTNAWLRQLFLLGAPQGVNWGAELFDSDTLPGWEAIGSRDRIEREKGYRHFQLWTDDNIDNLPEDYIQVLMDTFGGNSNLVRAYRFGIFCPLTEGAVYSNYVPQRHDLDDVEASPHRDLIAMFDFNANPMAWVAVQKIPFAEPGGRVHRYVALNEANQGHGQLEDAVVEFAGKFPRSQFAGTRIRVFGDRSGHAGSHKVFGSDYDTIERILKDLGYKHVEICATHEVAPEAASADAVQQLFRRNLLLVCRRCSLLRRSLLATNWKKGIRKIEKKNGETHTHHGDALKYWAWQETREETGSGRSMLIGTN